MIFKARLLMAIWLISAVSCGPRKPTVLTIMTHDSFAISEQTLKDFESIHGVTVTLLPSGDAGAALNQAILARDAPLADVFYGVDNTFMGRALAADLFISYRPEHLDAVPNNLELDASGRLTPIDFGDVCLNYDIARLAELGVSPPVALKDLTDPAYHGLLVVENPATSSPGLAFMLATVGVFGTDGPYSFLDYWADLRANDVLVTSGWEDAYWGQFSGAGDGTYPLVISYASSPPAEVFYGELEASPTASVTEDDTCFRQIEFAGILKGSANQRIAEAFLEFMLSPEFQEDVPLNMFVYPANQTAALPEVFTRWTSVPEKPVLLDPQLIDANRDKWIEQWTDVVLR